MMRRQMMRMSAGHRSGDRCDAALVPAHLKFGDASFNRCALGCCHLRICISPGRLAEWHVVGSGLY